jgi:hypothetical protein
VEHGAHFLILYYPQQRTQVPCNSLDACITRADAVTTQLGLRPAAPPAYPPFAPQVRSELFRIVSNCFEFQFQGWASFFHYRPGLCQCRFRTAYIGPKSPDFSNN